MDNSSTRHDTPIGTRHPLKPRLSRLKSAPKDLIVPEEGPLEDLNRISSIFEDSSIVDRKGSFITFDHVILRRILMNNTVFRTLSLKDVSMSGCDLASASWPSSFWDRVDVQSGRMTGLDLSGGRLQNVIFKDCKIDLASFRFMKGKAIRFEDCSLREADFQGSDLRGCAFRGCDLRQAQMSQTKLEGVDLRDSKIEGLKVEHDNLKNVTVDVIQAAYLSGLLGLIIVCKAEFTQLHQFYDAMCPECAELNYQKRFQTASLKGQVALITGSWLKIGYQATLMMLRAGARVICQQMPKTF